MYLRIVDKGHRYNVHECDNGQYNQSTDTRSIKQIAQHVCNENGGTSLVGTELSERNSCSNVLLHFSADPLCFVERTKGHWWIEYLSCQLSQYAVTLPYAIDFSGILEVWSNGETKNEKEKSLLTYPLVNSCRKDMENSNQERVLATLNRYESWIAHILYFHYTFLHLNIEMYGPLVVII